eukprot:TRINITY_DN67858_c11_g1_i1.p2 TRINITY_DN67858_c11_g1~~TRINITY_DN67858_c11_g1_i1.p2  ORF type:complete len:276 (+),score=66.97 TRINITY_DN67858_c11_g1_i1:140-967(+)
MAGAVWAWRDDYGEWHDYDKKTSQQLEEGYIGGKKTMQINTNGYNYTIDFPKLKQVNERTKRSREIKQVKASKPTMSKEMEALFDKYQKVGAEESGEDLDCMQGSAFVTLSEDLGIDVEDPVIMAVAWKTGAKQPFKISREEWARGMSNLRTDTLKKLKAALPGLKNEIKDCRGPAFKSFYNFTFEFARDNPQAAILTVDTATAYWQLLLKGAGWALLDDWIQFINEVHKKAVSRDCWQMLLEFTKANPADYNPDTSTWPSVVDEFMDWYLAKKK